MPKIPSLLTAVSLFFATPVLAVDVQVLGGQSTASYKYTNANNAPATKTITGTGYSAAVDAEPFMFPFALGLTMNSVTYDETKALQQSMDDTFGAGVASGVSGTLTSLTYGPEALLWAPFPFIKPYLRLAYLFGTFKETLGAAVLASTGSGPDKIAASSAYSSTGTEAGVGLRLNPWPLVGILVEYDSQNDQRTMKSSSTVTVDGQTGPATLVDDSFNSKTIKIGLELAW